MLPARATAKLKIGITGPLAEGLVTWLAHQVTSLACLMSDTDNLTPPRQLQAAGPSTCRKLTDVYHTPSMST
jgi:hypothetical protein